VDPRGLNEPSVAPLLATLRQTLDSFVEIGLGYFSLDRPPGTLSGGEAQRTKVIRHLGSSPTDVTYVFEGAPADLVAARSTRTEDGLSGID
jgi:excinuclease UvrABC ATPase subunit